jgi:hypothetical protein
MRLKVCDRLCLFGYNTNINLRLQLNQSKSSMISSSDVFTYEVVAMLSMDAPLALNLVLMSPEPWVWPRGDGQQRVGPFV